MYLPRCKQCQITGIFSTGGSQIKLTAVWTRLETGDKKATAETPMFSPINCMFLPLLPGCVTHLKVLFVFAGIYRDTEKKIVVMETAGAEALSVFPSENPSRPIRISTAKKVCWGFILCNARWFPSASLPPLTLAEIRQSITPCS